MQIREAILRDSDGIRNIYLQAFDKSEAEIISDFAVNLLNDKSRIKIISLVAIQNNEVIGHTSFSPVCLKDKHEHFAYILAPLAVSPKFQLVNYGLDAISNIGSFIVFVYGDPLYYSRFGFNTDLAKNFSPPHSLQYPEGWHALKLNSSFFPKGGTIQCVDSLNDPNLW